MEFIVVALASLLISGLTLYSGFGLGTLLLPVFVLFFPVGVAVAAVAIVHCANNIFKIAVVGRHADHKLILQFGLPAIFSAFAGAAALGYVSHFQEIARYSFGPATGVITPVKLAMSFLMVTFALFELLPPLQKLKFDKKYLLFGGILSGFFGGFSGHQGALRSAFLAKVGISAQAFVGTNAAIGFMVDMARILTYALTFFAAKTVSPITAVHWPLILMAIISAFTGVMIGKRFLHKVTMSVVQIVTGSLLLVLALALGAGVI